MRSWGRVDNWPRVGRKMTEPVAKRVCSAVTGVLKRIAVEGNIGELAVAFRMGHAYRLHCTVTLCAMWD